jgi:peptidoglycan/LPS O-acetylase OafA/YrhL
MRQLCFVIIGVSLLTRIAITHPPLSPELLGRILPSRAGEMGLGALISLEARERTILTPILRGSFLPLGLLCAVWMWFGLDITSPVGSILGLQLIALACAALIASALVPNSWTARILGSKYFALGGKKYAFAMYIFHPLILSLCIHYLPNSSKVIRLGIFAVITVAVSALSYRHYEYPFLQMSFGRTTRKAPGDRQPPLDSAIPHLPHKISNSPSRTSSSANHGRTLPRNARMAALNCSGLCSGAKWLTP